MPDEILPADRVLAPGDVPAAASSVVSRSSDPWFVDVESEAWISMHRVRQLLGTRRSRHQLVQIIRLEEHGKALVLDGRVQMAASDEHIYHEMFVHPAMVWGQCSSVLVLGGGDGCLVRELVKWPCVERVLVVELDAEVVQVCRDLAPEWAGALEDSRVELVHEDAMNVLQLEEKFDLILADLTEPYDDSGVAGQLSSSLFSPEFYSSVKERLEPGGLFVAQTGGLRLGASSLDPHHVKFVNDIRQAFGEVRVAYEYIPSFHAFWTVTLASSISFEDGTGLEEMWFTFERSVWQQIDRILDQEGVVTRYYDGMTHLRLFSAPVDQAELYGWGERPAP